MIIYTIGFTKKTAEQFFETLKSTGAKHLLDIRLNNTSQLAGFTKRGDLHYFLHNISNIQYHEMPILAPNGNILSDYRKSKSKDWAKYEEAYLNLIKQRQVELNIDIRLFQEGVVLLCSEAKADQCHRRLAAEYLKKALFNDAFIKHL